MTLNPATGEGFTTAQLLSVCLRELYFRRRVYPRRVAEGHMKQHVADFQTAAMEALCERLQAEIDHPQE